MGHDPYRYEKDEQKSLAMKRKRERRSAVLQLSIELGEVVEQLDTLKVRKRELEQELDKAMDL